MKREAFLATAASAVLAGCSASAVAPVPGGSSDARPGLQKAQRGPDGLQLLGSLLLVPYTFVPVDFAACDGALVPISTNEALFSLIGTKFGGNGRTNFALPDMRGREPIKQLSYVIAIDGAFPGRPQRIKGGGTPPLVGQLLLVPYLPAFVPPAGWLAANGQLVNIKNNELLYSVVGTTFGGNGQTNFALPDLRGREPIKGLTYLIATTGRYPRQA